MLCQQQFSFNKTIRVDNVEPITVLLVGSLFTLVTGLVSAFIMHRIKTQEGKLDTLTTDVSTLKSTAVSDSHVRAVVKEELQPLNATLTKVADSMEAIKEYIAEEKGFKAGAAAARRRVEDEV